MRSRQTGGHTIDVLFPLAVFFAFAASAVMAILLAANIYSSAVTGSERMYNASTALSYIREKVHQNDTAGAVQIEIRTTDGICWTSGDLPAKRFRSSCWKYSALIPTAEN